MSEFLSILALCYACDAAAATRPLSHAEVMACMDHYDSVKSYFAHPEAAQQDPAGAYRSFKDWERANADMVAQLRSPTMD